jgi:hypothetical protein
MKAYYDFKSSVKKIQLGEHFKSMYTLTISMYDANLKISQGGKKAMICH